MAVAYEPMRLYRSGVGCPVLEHPDENASSTFKEGVPLVLSSGIAQEAAFGAAETVYGVSAEAGHNLTTDGTAEDLSYLTPPNMPNAKTIPVGAPIKDGKIKCYRADGQNVFSIMLKDGQTYSAANLGVSYGITKDNTSGFWYVDTADTAGDNVVVEVVGVDLSSANTVAAGARVLVRFLSSKRFFD